MQPTKLLKALLVLLTTVFLVTLAHAESEESTHDLSEGNTFVSADQDASMAEPGNDYAMSCGGHKETTFECQRDPYKYYCNKQGKLKYSKRDTTICDWCECINLKPKPNCIINLIGQANCARDLGNETQWEWRDDFDKAQAIKKQQKTIEKGAETDLSIKPGGPVPEPQSSAASRLGMPTLLRKLSTVVGTITGLAIPKHDSAKNCIASATPVDLSCELGHKV